MDYEFSFEEADALLHRNWFYQDEDIDLLKSTAIKIQSGKHLSLSDALALMHIVMRNRPDGPLINQRVKDWTEQLKSVNGP